MNGNPEEPLVALEARRGRFHLRMTAMSMGRDLCVTLSGGDRPHIGAVALGSPGTPSSALALPKHREGELARNIAAALVSNFNITVCVACGIHLDDILETEIQDALEMAEELTRELVGHLERTPSGERGKT